jgi:pimeloyl-ACP methyl ester carboxylesterase
MAVDTRLVCVPGLGLRDLAWKPFLRVLREAWPALRAEVAPLPGYGVPRQPGDRIGPVDLARRLVETCAVEGGTTVLLGHSASCQIIAHAAVLAPGSTQALVLVGPTTDPRAATWTALAQRWIATAIHETPGQLSAVASCYRRTGARSIMQAMNAARRDDIRAPLSLVTSPVLVVRGRHDRICPPDWADNLAALGPLGSRSTSLRSGAHMVPLTDGRRLAEVVRDFLSRTVDPFRGTPSRECDAPSDE